MALLFLLALFRKYLLPSPEMVLIPGRVPSTWGSLCCSKGEEATDIKLKTTSASYHLTGAGHGREQLEEKRGTGARTARRGFSLHGKAASGDGACRGHCSRWCGTKVSTGRNGRPQGLLGSLRVPCRPEGQRALEQGSARWTGARLLLMKTASSGRKHMVRFGDSWPGQCVAAAVKAARAEADCKGCR